MFIFVRDIIYYIIFFLKNPDILQKKICSKEHICYYSEVDKIKAIERYE